MKQSSHGAWVAAVSETVESHRRLIDSVCEQLSDAEMHARPAAGFNSVAIILRHLGGNLHSRWTDFISTDGEKPDRDREAEFQTWEGDRNSLMDYFDAGWNALSAAVQQLDDSNLDQRIHIRGEPHTLQQAVLRSMTHVAYHAGQIAMIGRMVHDGDWRLVDDRARK